MRVPKPWLRASTGTWYVQIDGKQVNLGKDESKAHAKLRAMLDSGAHGDYTVRQVVTAYWDWMKKNLAESTYERRKEPLESFSAFVSPKLKATALRPLHVQRWVDANDKAKVNSKAGTVETDRLVSPTTVGDRIGLIKGMMAWAKSMGYAERNPIEDMPKPTARIRQEFLPANIWPRVVALALDQPFRDYLTVMLSSGARPTEMLKFEAANLDGNRFILLIEKSKGKKRSRVVYLPDDALAIVKRLAKQYPHGKLFRNPEGVPWNKSSIRGRFKRLKRELEMPTLSPTVLRHSFAHHRLSSGQDALTVAKLMGHVDTRMLATRYGHLDANSDYMTSAANGVAFPSLPTTAANPAV
jgi:integrase